MHWERSRWNPLLRRRGRQKVVGDLASNLRLRLQQPAGICGVMAKIGRNRQPQMRFDRRSWPASLTYGLCGGFLDGVTNAQIGSAAADVAGHGVVDVGVGRMWV